MTERTDHWAVWLTLLLCVLAFVLDTAADLRDAQQQASAEWRAELKHAQALALLAASTRE